MFCPLISRISKGPLYINWNLLQGSFRISIFSPTLNSTLFVRLSWYFLVAIFNFSFLFVVKFASRRILVQTVNICSRMRHLAWCYNKTKNSWHIHLTQPSFHLSTHECIHLVICGYVQQYRAFRGGTLSRLHANFSPACIDQ